MTYGFKNRENLSHFSWNNSAISRVMPLVLRLSERNTSFCKILWNDVRLTVINHSECQIIAADSVNKNPNLLQSLRRHQFPYNEQLQNIPQSLLQLTLRYLKEMTWSLVEIYQNSVLFWRELKCSDYRIQIHFVAIISISKVRVITVHRGTGYYLSGISSLAKPFSVYRCNSSTFG